MGMLSLIFSSIVLGQGSIPQTVKPKVISVSMLKNGYAFVTREIPITDNSANIVEVPQTSLGSLWFWTNEGQIDSVTNVLDRTPYSVKVPFGSFQEVLSNNIGKKFSFVMLYTEEKDGHKSDRRQQVEGVLKSFTTESFAVEGVEGTYILPFNKVEGVTAKDSSVVLIREEKGENPVHYYKILTKNNAKSVMMMSLERGMAWAPGYSIDLSAPDKLVFTAKSTVLNDLLDLDNSKVRLITGFPNLQFQNILDPLTSGMSVDDWLRSISGGVPGGVGGGMGGGGFGSQFGNNRAGELTKKPAATLQGKALVPDSVDHISFDPTDNSLIVRDAPGEQLEDLFYYDIDKVTLKKGSRSYQYLYQFEAPYKRTYSWDGEPGTPIFNKIKFKNQTGKPISTAAASMFKKGEIVGQGTMTYTAANTEAELTVSRSLDFPTTSTTELIDRAVGAVKDKKGVATMDLITYETEMTIENPREEAVNFSIRKLIQGEITKSEPKADITTSKTGIRGSNPISTAKWDLKIDAGKTEKLTIRYKVYVPTGQ